MVKETEMVSIVRGWYENKHEKTQMGSKIYSLWYLNQEFANGEGELLLELG